MILSTIVLLSKEKRYGSQEVTWDITFDIAFLAFREPVTRPKDPGKVEGQTCLTVSLGMHGCGIPIKSADFIYVYETPFF